MTGLTIGAAALDGSDEGDDVIINPYRFAAAGAGQHIAQSATNDGVSTPNASALQLADNLDLRIDVEMDDWTPPQLSALIYKNGSTVEYGFFVNTNGTIRSFMTPNGNLRNRSSSVSTGFTDGTRHQLRITRSGTDLRFFTRATGTPLTDASGWSQLGSALTEDSGPNNTGTGDLGVGNDPRNLNVGLSGKIYDAVVYNSVGGSGTGSALVARLDPNDATVGDTGADTFIDSDTSVTWTLANGATVA